MLVVASVVSELLVVPGIGPTVKLQGVVVVRLGASVLSEVVVVLELDSVVGHVRRVSVVVVVVV